MLALVALLALALLVVALALRNRQPPLLPADADHARFTGAAACDACHGPAGVYPREPDHPQGRDCIRCHGSR